MLDVDDILAELRIQRESPNPGEVEQANNAIDQIRSILREGTVTIGRLVYILNDQMENAADPETYDRAKGTIEEIVLAIIMLNGRLEDHYQNSEVVDE